MIAIFRRALAALVVLTALSAVTAARAEPSADPKAAQSFIRDLADRALVLVNDKSLGAKDRAERFRALFAASFDIPEIGKFVLGRHWKTASDDQRGAFVKAFEDFTVYTWSTRFKDYSGVSFTVLGGSNEGTDALVDSRIERTHGDPIPLQWRVHQIAPGLRITDILVEGVSMALTQRQDFAALLQSNGGKIDALLEAMNQKTDELKELK